ncbi:MAG: SDR family NAD(P)-dependent oxidoreductase, partial [Propionibacteriales bacterium]|nr:SDR family NAD(P)-dependent oxidoreductase [Propionibacteriales bacterium]
MNVDLQQRTAVVTGASSGLGEETARVLAGAGAKVILAVRNRDRGADAARRIAKGAPHADLAIEQIDLGDLDSVRAFGERYRDATIDILVNNAGAVASPERTVTVDGFEAHMGVNHLGHFVLTHALLPALLRSSYARIVSLSSIMHRFTGALDATLDQGRYRPSNAYAQSKLACGLFGLELDRRAKATGLHLTSVVAHPGWSNTHLFPTVQSDDGGVPFFSRFLGRIGGVLASDPTQ